MDPAPTNQWKILYNTFDGLQRRAVELVHKQLGARVLRDGNTYTLHTLAIEPEGAPLARNTVVVGRHDQSPLVRAHIGRHEIPKGGYAVRVLANPEHPDGNLVLITGEGDRELYYGAADFVFDYLTEAAPRNSSVRNTWDTFAKPLPVHFRASAPAIRTRGVWTWAHPINDYRAYIENLANLRLNQLTLWNDYPPLNAADIIAHAHSYGIKVIWGFAWGWSTRCGGIDLDRLPALTAQVAETFRRDYAPLGVDGIYFQSFTELHQETIGGRLIAPAVVGFVNATAAKLYRTHPDLKIQFGLHATSVRKRLGDIAHIDPRIEIVWEDCGPAPYSYFHGEQDEAAFADNVRFTDQMLDLRPDGKSGLAYKGHVVMDWTRFVHQSGPYILGEASRELIRHDVEMLVPLWRVVQADWLKYGEQTHRMTRHIADKTGGDTDICIVGNFAGGCWYSLALTAQMLWDPRESYADTCARAARRSDVTFA